MRSAHLLVNLDTITANVRSVQRLVGEAVRVIAVVKADAYGLGAVPVARACVTGGAQMLAVALAEEGMALRRHGILKPILVMGPVLPEAMAELVEWNLTATLSTVEQARALSQAAEAAGILAPAHLKVDTGMSRLGFRTDELPEALPQLASLPGIVYDGLFSHLANPVADGLFTAGQADSFRRSVAAAQEVLGPLPWQHLCSSPGMILHPNLHFTAVRPGEMIYSRPLALPEGVTANVQDAVSLRAQVALVKQVKQGEQVSYGGTWTAPCDTTLAIVPVGYADGYPRALSGRAQVLIGGQRRPVVGRVCMDCCLVDVGPSSPCRAGDEVVLFGQQEAQTIQIGEVSAWAGTINQEILARLGCRLPRIYHTDEVMP